MERPRRPLALPILSGRELINLALLLSFPAVALEEFLRNPVAQFTAQPVLQLQHWVTEALMTIPLFAVGVWAGDRIAARAGLGVANRPAILKRALLIAGFAAVALMPVWFERNKTDGLVQTQALVTPHSHGGVDVYWAGSAVIVALACVCLVPGTAWVGYGIARRLAARRLRRPRAVGAGLVIGAAAASRWPGCCTTRRNRRTRARSTTPARCFPFPCTRTHSSADTLRIRRPAGRLRPRRSLSFTR